MPSLGGSEIIIVLVIIVLLFGSSQLPKLAKSIGQAQKEFKSGLAEGESEDSPAEDSAVKDVAE